MEREFPSYAGNSPLGDYLLILYATPKEQSPGRDRIANFP
jgi:hypothetical protein